MERRMPYVIETWDKPDHLDLRMKVRPDHIAFLRANVDKLLGAGAKLDDNGETMLGTIYIVATDSREAAEAFVAADPFSQAGLPERVSITRWRKAFFNFEDRMGEL
jgi:uncharacterized protein YciI